jgi:hypothetical protein
VPPRAVLLDTSFVIALENRGDPHHERAKSLDRELLCQDVAAKRVKEKPTYFDRSRSCRARHCRACSGRPQPS